MARIVKDVPSIPPVSTPSFVGIHASGSNTPLPSPTQLTPGSKQAWEHDTAENLVAQSAAGQPSQRQVVGSTAASGGFSPAAAAPQSATDNSDYLNGDAQYQLQLASLMKALGDEQADVGNQRTQYNNDYGTAVKNLGWEQPDPTNAADQGQWNFGDTNTAAGRAFQNQQNDYAGRGLLQSSAYGTANDNLTRSLNDQLNSTNTAKTNFLNNLSQTQQAFQTDNQQQQQQARIDALNRLAAGVSPVAV